MLVRLNKTIDWKKESRCRFNNLMRGLVLK